MKPPITPNQVNLELFAALSYIMNKGEIKKTEAVKAETKKTETAVKKMSISCSPPLVTSQVPVLFKHFTLRPIVSELQQAN